VFGNLDEHMRLVSHEDHDLWHMSAYLPNGRENEVAEWMVVHGIEIYRMAPVSELIRKRP
jgi:hypothetical protein